MTKDELSGYTTKQLPTDAGGSIIGLDQSSPYARHGVLVDPRRALLMENVERSGVLYLFDADGAAAIISELTGLATRIGPGFAKYLTKRLEDVP